MLVAEPRRQPDYDSGVQAGCVHQQLPEMRVIGRANWFSMTMGRPFGVARPTTSTAKVPTGTSRPMTSIWKPSASASRTMFSYSHGVKWWAHGAYLAGVGTLESSKLGH
jgi:hypothetical protein